MQVLQLIAAAVGCALAFAVTGVIVTRPLLHRHVGSNHNSVLSAIFEVGGTIYAVFLAFLVVAVWEAHDAAHANIAEEASLLSTLYRGSTAMEPGPGGEMRHLIRRYTHAVIADEWPVQARTGGASEQARAAGLGMFRLFGRMSTATRAHDATVDSAELSMITQLHADRNKRTLQAEESVSPVIWSAAVINGLLVVVMSFFLYTERFWPQVLLSGILATMIAMMLCVVFIFERPFSGLLPLQPEAFTHSLTVYDSVDRTP